MQENNRIDFLDHFRAISMLWIVGVWHLSNYYNYSIENAVTSSITLAALIGFMYISGYFLGKKKVYDRQSIIMFYKKRFMRIYPLFFLSTTFIYIYCELFNATLITSFKQYILTLVGLVWLRPPMPNTIWFISLLLFFYIITPVISICDKIKNKIMVSTTIFVVLFFVCSIFETDIRILMYFPVYCIGLITSGVSFNKKINIKFLFLTILGYFIFLLIDLFYLEHTVIDMICGILFFVSFLQICKLFKNKVIKEVLNQISAGSMCAYLFHRPWYSVVSYFVGEFDLIIGVISVVVIIIGSILVQKMYDSILKKICKK